MYSARVWAVVGVSGLIVSTIVGCTQETAGQMMGPSQQPPAAQQGNKTSTTTTPPTSTSCSLKNAGLTFKSATCDSCMETQCCGDVIKCYPNDKDCAELVVCADACYAQYPNGPTGGGGDAGAGGADAGGGTTGNGLAVFTAEVHPSLKATCSSCHGAPGTAPRFFGADAAASYPLFKSFGLNSGDLLLVKGAHAGPVLTAAQKAIVQKWLTAEKSAGTGGGGGGGTGGGTGGGGAGTGNGQARGTCLTTCYDKHPATATTGKNFVTCRRETCADKCP